MTDRICPVCGAAVDSAAPCCPVCGASLTAAPEAPAQDAYGYAAPAQDVNAEPYQNDRAPVEQPSVQYAPAQPAKAAPPAKKKSKLGLIIGIAAAVLVIAGGVLAFVLLGGKSEKPELPPEEPGVSDREKGSDPAEQPASDSAASESPQTSPGAHSAGVTQVASFSMRDLSDGGTLDLLTYRDPNTHLYGMLDADGHATTDAVFEKVELVDFSYYLATGTTVSNAETLDQINSKGLYSQDGKEIIPPEYGLINILSERYAEVIKAERETDDKDETLMYVTQHTMSLSAADDDVKFAGTYYVIDLTTGKPVPGVSGHEGYRIDCIGKWITFVDEARKDYKTVDDQGKMIRGGAQPLENDNYTMYDENRDLMVYDGATQKKLFSLSHNSFEAPHALGRNSLVDRDLYVVNRKGSDSKEVVVLDNSGNELFSFRSPDGSSSSAKLVGEWIQCGSTVYDLQGNCIMEKGCSRLLCMKMQDFAYQVELEGGGYRLFRKDGTVLIDVPKNGGSAVMDTSRMPYSISGSDKLWLNWSDGTYSIKGDVIRIGYVKEPSGSVFNLVDVFTGERVLEKYRDYQIIKLANGKIRILAVGTANQIVDIFEVN